mmetsp:Transcript_19631/g.28232  ORF Transcript_19631/g.28232 Transcript_19631/m.28232 type:complete len:97 (-) Transcript_19631:2255-2545(-)
MTALFEITSTSTTCRQGIFTQQLLPKPSASRLATSSPAGRAKSSVSTSACAAAEPAGAARADILIAATVPELDELKEEDKRLDVLLNRLLNSRAIA